MSAMDIQPPAPRTPARSRKLLVAVLLLLILSLVLPVLLCGLAQEWFYPIISSQLDQCGLDSICQAATDEIRRTWLLILGPPFLVAVASLLLGVVGLIRARWRITSPKNMILLWSSAIWGLIWALLFGWWYWLIFNLATIHDL